MRDEGGRGGEGGFEIIGELWAVETIAVGSGIRDLARLRRAYGNGRWRKRKGFALVRVEGVAEVVTAEFHWYKAAGIGRRELKLKRCLE